MKKTLAIIGLLLAFAASTTATEITIPSFTIPNFAGSGAPKVRVYYSTTFTASDGTVVAQGTPSGGTIYKVVSTTLNLGTVTVPAFTIQSTTDGIDFKTARASFYLYNGSAQVSPNPLSPYTSLIVPPLISSATGCSPSGTCASLAELKIWTNGSPPLPPDTYYTKSDIDRLLAALGPGSTFTLAAGSSGSDFNVSGTSPNFTVNLPEASAASSGKVTTGTQSFAGLKTFNNNLALLGSLAGTTANFSGAITVGSCIGCGGGTVSAVTATNANGLTWTITNPTTAPNLSVALGAITPTTVNGNTFTAGTYTLTGAAGKTLTFNKSITLEGTDSTTMTFPATSATVARTDAGQAFTGVNTMTSPVFVTPALGAATATSINGLTITSGTGTLTIPNGSSLVRVGAHALTLTTAGATNVTFPTSGTLLTTAATALPNLAQVGTITSGTIAGGAVLGQVTVTMGADGTGDMYYRNASGVLTRIPAGAFGTFLGMGGSNVPFWTSGGGGGTPPGSDTQVTYNASGFFSGATGVLTNGTNLTVRGALNSCQDAGANDSYACSLTPAISAYATGQISWFKANTANTGAATLDLNALGAKAIVKVAGGIATTLGNNDIRAGQWVEVQYDGTNFQMQSMLGNAGSGTVTSVAQSFTGGLISVAGSPITASGTLALTVAGTSGGIPYFSGAATWASSGALIANLQ